MPVMYLGARAFAGDGLVKLALCEENPVAYRLPVN